MLFRNTFRSFRARSTSKAKRTSSAGPAITGIRSMASAGVLAATITAPKQALPVPEDVHLKSHHQKNGRFDNPWPSFRGMEPLKIMPAIVAARIRDGIPNTSKDENKFKIIKPDFIKTRNTDITQLRCTWLGHACALIEFPGGLRVLFDPVFCNRCSPSQWFGPARYTPAPCDVDDIPFIDAVVISHAHYDHLDLTTVKKIHKKHPNVQFFAPMNNKAWFEASGIPNATDMDWWDDKDFSITVPEEGGSTTTVSGTFSCLPCQHIANRGLFDRNATLWASWAVMSGGKSVWFGGDTGYRAVPYLPEGVDDYGEEFSHLPHCPAFKQIGDLRGPFDLGLIPIGAYKPRYIMSSVHCNPFDSVNVFVDTKCKKAIGIHYGAWILTEEPVKEPPLKLKEALRWKGLPEEGVFDVMEHGETREF